MRKWLVDNTLPKPKKELKFEVGGNKKYKVKAVTESAVYSQ